MPAFGPFTVQDREVTPVDHTFQPKGSPDGVNLYKEGHASGVAIGDNILSTSMKETQTRLNGTMKLSLPVLTSEVGEGGNTTYEVARVARVEVRVSFDKSSTEEERANAIGMAVNALAESNSQVNALFVENNSIY